MTERARKVSPPKKGIFRAVFFDAGNTLVRAHPSVGHIYAHTARRLVDCFSRLWTTPLRSSNHGKPGSHNIYKLSLVRGLFLTMKW